MKKEQIQELIDAEFFDDNEENCVDYSLSNWQQTEGKSVTGFYLLESLANDPLVKQSQSCSLEERSAIMAECRNVFLNPKSTGRERDKAAHKAICLLYGLIVTLVSRFCKGGISAVISVEDYVQIAIMAVLRDLKDYDESLSVTSFFYLRIKHDLIKEMATIQNVSRYYNEQLTKVRKKYNEIASTGKKPQTVDLAYAFPELSQHTLQKCLEIISSPSVELTEDREDITSLSTEEEVELKNDAELLNEGLSKLDNIEKEVLCYTYAIADHPRISQKAIAKKLKVYPEIVRIKLHSGESKLRRFLIKKGFRDNDEKVRQNNLLDRTNSLLVFGDDDKNNSELLNCSFED